MRYNCILCGHTPEHIFSKEQMVQHCKDAIHCATVQSLIDAQDVAKVETFQCHIKHDAMCPRIEKLGHVDWQDKVRANLCLYLGSIGKDKAAFTRAVNDIFKYEHMERISLLELGVWKAACILDKDESKKIHEMMEWVNHGWKQNKTRLRHSTATTVIVESVLGFMEGP
jgi:hypothetical protein